MSMFVDHPLIKKDSIEQREYQTNLAKSSLKGSTLIVLPTGMGKTIIAILVIAEVLRQKGGKALFLAPTKPLVEQHACFLAEHLVGKKVAVMTGEVPPEDRELLWLENDIIASTPQVVANDLRAERVSLKDVKIIIFDEAHRSVGNYAYVEVAQEYAAYGGLILGMTASPGSDASRIKEVCKNLGIERVEIKSEADPDVARYVHEIEMDFVEVEVPEQLKRIIVVLKGLFDSYVRELTNMGLLEKGRPVTTKNLLEVGSILQARLRSGERNRNMFHALSVQAMAIKVEHALEMGETQGVTVLISYLDRLEQEAASDEGSKASRTIVKSHEFERARELLKGMKMEHPKLSRVMTVVARQVAEKPESRIIVFTHYRDTCDLVASKLAAIEGARVAKLVGQADRGEEKGLRQKEQVGVLDRFRAGEYNIIVATSVGEEGLDVASTDLVVFYEPVPSEIRTIQRRGRTGRKRAGRVVVLVTKGTRDEAYFYSSMNKETAMKKRLRRLQDELQGEVIKSLTDEEESKNRAETETPKGQARLSDF
jgi:ERCC4-related helicase